jgi:hypothetical protein
MLGYYNFMMTDVCVYSVSPLKSNCLLERTFSHKDIDLQITYNNKIGLSESYNRIINSEVKHKYIVFCHHDVSLEYTDLGYNIKRGLTKFDVIGVAGGRSPKIVEKNLWHWMVPQAEYHGFAAHAGPNNQMYVTNFGMTPERVAVLDGVFLAFEHEKIKKSAVQFDEQFIWHHYDIDFSLTCNKNKLRLGVYPILVYHESPGLKDLNDEEWNRSNTAFINKWNQS